MLTLMPRRSAKVVNQLRGEQSRQLIEAHGAIDDRYKWDEEKSKTPKKPVANKINFK